MIKITNAIKINFNNGSNTIKKLLNKSLKDWNQRTRVYKPHRIDKVAGLVVKKRVEKIVFPKRKLKSQKTCQVCSVKVFINIWIKRIATKATKCKTT